MPAGLPKPGPTSAPCVSEGEQRGAENGDRELDEERRAHQRSEEPLAGDRVELRFLAPAYVGDDEYVEDHHGAGVDDHLRSCHERRAQQQEQDRQREEVDDQGEDAVEGVAQDDDAEGAAEGAERRSEEEDGFHYSPSARSGVRSIASASSISLVKIRSSRS